MKGFLAVLMIFLTPSSYAKEFSCHLFLASGSEQNDAATVTTHFISYLSLLTDRQVITLEEIEVFKKNLEEKGVFINPLREETGERTDRKIHVDNLQTYVDQSSLLDKDQILKWLKNFLQANQKEQQSKKSAQAETAVPLQRMMFLPLDFVQLNQPKDVKLSHSIELMSTLVTQKMWMDVMGENPSYFKKGGDYPVEGITLWSALAFANKLSLQEGLKPFYNLDGLAWEGRAEDGTLKLDYEKYKTEQQLLHVIKQIEKPFQEEGTSKAYRLPTYLEQKVIFHHFYGVIKERIKDFIWVRENSDQMTHPVGITPTGYILEADEFSDYFGNVFTHATGALSAKENFHGKNWEMWSMTAGGSWDTLAGAYKFIDREENELVNRRSKELGLRLVRDVVVQKGGPK